MQRLLKHASLAYAAGNVGAVVNSLAAWLFVMLGISAALGVKMAPSLTVGWLYPRLVWGGLWGFLFLLPFLPGSPLLRGLLFSIGPTLGQLFIVFPFVLGKGMLGLGLGTLTPILVILFNAIWGIVASYWLELTQDE
ncbi:MAG: hypothetical protein AB1664_06030 [Thermodesulfobacteriota bacterium]